MEELTTEKQSYKTLNSSSEGVYKLQFRCPECVQLYEVSSLQISSAVPEFDCPACKCHFGFDYPPLNAQAIITYKLSNKESAFKIHCPKCQHFQSEKNKVCESCGVVIENFLLLKNETYPKVSVDLIKLWQNVIFHFDNQDLHFHFINKCHAKNQLDYARFKYQELKKTIGEIEIGDVMLKEINKLGLQQLNLKQEPQSSAGVRWDGSLRGILPAASKLYANFNQSIIGNNLSKITLFTGAFLIILGFLNIHFRNAIGGGMALIAVILGLKVLK